MSDLPDEVKQQIEAQKAQCIFCRIIAGEMDAHKIYEDEHIIGILDINPAAKGHALFMPKEHYPIMPLVPSDVFKHLFGRVPSILEATQKAMVRTGSTVFIANGAAAGQQSPHFLIHVIPREPGDGLPYAFDQDIDVDADKAQQVQQMFATNLPLMMRNHFTKSPAPWHSGKGTRPAYLHDTKPVVYEDERALVTFPTPPQGLGHTRVHSKELPDDFSHLSASSAAHLFYIASYAATAAFEGLKAQGSNIILRSGNTGDSTDPLCTIDVFARWQDDGLDLLWTPMTDKPDLGTVQQTLHDALYPLSQKPIDWAEPALVTAVHIDPHDPMAEVKEAIARLHKLNR